MTDANRWIPVTERLPDDSMTVLVCCPDSGSDPVWLGYCEGGEWYDAASAIPMLRTDYGEVRYWRDLPAPPEE